MKSNTFNYSLLAVGVAAVMGLSNSANAATSGPVGETTTSVEINNVATAKYNVAGIGQPDVTSNSVKITVSEQVSFSLVSNNLDETPLNDSNVNEEVAPNGIAVFKHTLTNTGNRADSYTLLLENVSEDNTNYDLDNSTVTFTIFTNGVAGTPTTTTVALANSQPFTLEKGQRVEFSINARTTGNKGGDTQDLKLSATSTILTSAKTLVNTDNSITKLPTFSIVKTTTNALDLNDANDTATYQIVVKNPKVTNTANVDYSKAATNIIIEDVLPTGLVVATPELTVTPSTGSSAGTLTQTTTGFTLTNASLAIDGTITIILNVKKGTGTLVPNALNHVKVTDDLDDNTDTANTLVDSTKTADEVNVSNFYPADDTDFTNGTVAPGTDGNDSTQPLTTINRQLTLTNPTTKEISPTTSTTAGNTAGQVTHQTVITNNGPAAEGTNANPLTFTITDGSNAQVNPIGPVTIVYDADGLATGSQPGQAITVVPVDGVYTINSSVLTNGIAPTGTVTINYNMGSTNAIIGTKEETVVTLIPVGEGKPSVNPTVTDTTNVKGLTLVKAQALDSDCDGTIDTGASFSSSATALPALPGQCVVYQITANNTSSATPAGLGFNITDLLIADAKSQFSAAADYVDTTGKIKVGSGTETNATDGTPSGTNTVPSIYANVATLTPGQSAVLKFRIKIKTAR